MRLNLNEWADSEKKMETSVKIEHRLPPHFEKSCDVFVTCNVRRCDHYFLLDMKTSSQLQICCQRCLQKTSVPYSHEMTLAVCRDETTADKVLQDYESIVAPSSIADLVEIITDELHLYSPKFHEKVENCDIFD